jgi:flagellar motor switch protein FliM
MNYRPHNFRRPSRLPGDLERRLTDWCGSAGPLATRKWARHLAYRLELRFEQLDIVRAAEAFAQLPDATVGYRAAFGPAPWQTILALPGPLALAVVAGLQGESVMALPEERELSPVEDALVQFLLRDFLLPALRDTWPGSTPLQLELGSREPHPKWSRAFPPEENLLVLGLEAEGPFGRQPMKWLLPHKPLVEFLLPPRTSEDAGRRGDTARQRLEASVREIPVPVSINLGQAQLTLPQLARLRVGDVIVLDQPITETLQARVGGQNKFRVWCGKIGSRHAFQIHSVHES